MRTVLSRNLLESGLYAGQDGVILALAEEGWHDRRRGLPPALGVKAPTMTRTIGRHGGAGLRRTPADDATMAGSPRSILTEPARLLQAIEHRAAISGERHRRTQRA